MGYSSFVRVFDHSGFVCDVPVKDIYRKQEGEPKFNDLLRRDELPDKVKAEIVVVSHKDGTQLGTLPYKYEGPVKEDLSKINFQCADLRYINFSDCNLTGAKLTSSLVHEAKFTACNLERADLNRIHAEHVDFSLADMTEANLNESFLWKSKFDMAKMSGTHLVEADLEGCSFEYASMDSCVMRNSIAREANFSNAVLHSADLRHTDMSKTILKGTDFSKANMDHADFASAAIEDIVLTDANTFATGIKEAARRQTAATTRKAKLK